MARNTKPAEPEAPKMQYSFMSLIKKSGEAPAKAGARATDPLGVAKAAIVKALDEQGHYLNLVEEGRGLPRTKKGTKTVSTWFTKTEEGYWTGIRYGQLPIPIGESKSHFIGNSDELRAFYAAVKEAIVKGEMDDTIQAMQSTRSSALRKAHARKAA